VGETIAILDRRSAESYDAALNRVLADAERQGLGRYCTDPVALGIIAKILREHYAKPPATKKKRR
jgi:hypothetical protein